MKHANFLCLMLLVFSKNWETQASFPTKENLESSIRLLIPVSDKIENEKCRNDSLFYLEELKQFKLWATQMFDATAKFPDGILVGSTYALGNFDECLKVTVPETVLNDGFKGKYCKVKITLNRANVSLTSDDPVNAWNRSAWIKIQSVTTDLSKTLRNQLHWSFCIPETCSDSDLKTHIEEVVDYIEEIFEVDVAADIAESDCQTNEEIRFETSAKIYMYSVLVYASFVTLCSLYDLFVTTRLFAAFKRRGNFHNFILCFSARNNMKKLVKFKEQENGLGCIHGLKALTMILIILGHRIMGTFASPLSNATFIEDMYEKIETMFLLNGTIIVDTFFTVSGFLVAYLFLSELKKKKSINIGFLYLHRYLRLTPVYAIVIGFYCLVFIKIGSGPLWNEKVGTECERCQKTWWLNLLYVNNYIDAQNLCMVQTWYLACEFQLFIIAPIIVYILYRFEKFGITFIIALISGSICSVFYLTFNQRLDGALLLYIRTMKDPATDFSFRTIYTPTHIRISSYFLGVAFGYFKYKMDQSHFKISNLVSILMWILGFSASIGTMFVAWIFYMPDRAYNPWISASYGALSHIIWSATICNLILLITTGNGVFFDRILSWKPLVTLSRLTYCTFLCHTGIQLYSIGVLRTPVQPTVAYFTWYHWADTFLSFGLGFVLNILFEAPIIALEKLLKAKGSKREYSMDEKIVDDNPPYVLKYK